MIPNTWNRENYDTFLQYLQSISDFKYKNFHSKLIGNDNLYGVRTPDLKIIAKEIAQGDYISFIKCNNKIIYEEQLLYGLVLGYIKVPFNSLLEMLDEFIIYNNNWAINDITCANMKAFKKNKEDGLFYIHKCINSDNPWSIRFGIVLLLDFYVNDNYIDEIFSICDDIQNDEYYVKMAIAWLISICYIKCRNQTIKYLNCNKLDKWTYNKAIQKIIESKRISKEEKEILKKLKR